MAFFFQSRSSLFSWKMETKNESNHDASGRHPNQQANVATKIVPKSQKDCNAWRSKGRCNKFERGKCPYRHDENVQQIAIARKEQKMIEYLKNSSNQKGKNGSSQTTTTNDQKIQRLNDNQYSSSSSSSSSPSPNLKSKKRIIIH